ncbi:DUF6338 family protein [Nocardioides sp. NPDC000445]|uniref:DUF6338 family protein n=1 Tax=Nocardioides sp. NPDC000445 TaxID=3154257 RepID=UPI00331A98AB
MPNSFVGLLLFVVALAPGAIFLSIHHRGPYAPRSKSALHELSTVVLSSLAFDAVALVLVRVIAPKSGPVALDIEALVSSPRVYVRNSFDLVAFWFALLLLVAMFLAVAVAGMLNHPKVRDRVRNSAPTRLLLPATATRTVSGWTQLFHETDSDMYKEVTCHFDDGSRVVGWLQTFNPEAADTADRDIVLAAPITYYSKDGVVDVKDYGAVAVSARAMRFLYVDHWPEPPEPPDPQ